MTSYQNELFSVDIAMPIAPEVIAADAPGHAGHLTQFDLIDQLLGQYKQREQAIYTTQAQLQDALSMGVMTYFLDGMQLRYGPECRPTVPTDAESAIACLRIEYWNRILADTGIFNLMPAVKRKAAQAQFSGLDCPPFDENTVRPTLLDLTHQRQTFFAERVDGIFQSLSKTHITNSPSGFSKKMILAGCFNKHGDLDSHMAAVISDLRGVVGRLTGRGEPSEYGTRKLLSRIYETAIGKRVALDGGAFTVYVYKVGTVHFEVAPEVAIELNSVLAHLYPTAIPSRFRKPPKKAKPSSFDLKSVRLPFGVIDLLSSIEFRSTYNSLSTFRKEADALAATIEVIKDIGGSVRYSHDKTTIWVDFDYDAKGVIDQIIMTGAVPEQASYQFYPTRSLISDEAAERLQIVAGKTYCEPSAGVGDLARHLPVETTTCIELSQVRSKVLQAKGFKTVQADFLSWSEENSHMRFDGILMNPPFSKGRAVAHLQAAASLLADDGRLVAILPASMVNTQPVDGFHHSWSDVFEDQFEGTAVKVSILTATRR